MKRVVLLLIISTSIYKLSAQVVDSIIDVRDGQVYKIVKIGEQWWMAENLNIGEFVHSIYIAPQLPYLLGHSDVANNGIIEKYCYHNDSLYCEVYGGLYDWNEMMCYDPSVTNTIEITQGICPVGWYLPTNEGWTELVDFLGGESIAGGKMKETGTTHWRFPNEEATNESGFTALPGSYRAISGSFGGTGEDIGWHSRFWSSNKYYSNNYYYYMYTSAQIHKSTSEEIYGYSVRCLRDSSQFSYLTISDSNFRSISSLNIYGEGNEKIVIIINSSFKTVNISSIYNNDDIFNLNKSSSVLSPGESIHLTVTFNPPSKGTYLDSLYIKSDDPYDSLITIPLNGTFPPEILFTDSVNISCFGYSDGSATVTPSLGTPPYQYEWDDPQKTTDSTITSLKANIYYHVTVTDNLGYTIKDSIILTQPTQLELNPQYSNTICLNSNNGFIELNPSGGIPPYSFIWSDSQTSQIRSNLSAGQYSVKVTDSHGCVDSSDFTIHPAVPYDGEQICIVTIDLLTGNNIIVWEKKPDVGIAAYNIYRESTIGVYNKIGIVSIDELSIIKDTTANPESRAYLYKITAVDTCNNESPLESSKYHRPSFLQYVSSEGGVNLEWTDYSIQGVADIGEFLTSYAIYRGTDSTGLEEYLVVGSINTWTDTDPNALKWRYYYRVAAIFKEPCYPSGSIKGVPIDYRLSMSNLEDNQVVYIADYKPSAQLFVYPNPFSENAVIKFPNPNGDIYRLILTDLSGRIFIDMDKITSGELVLIKEDLPSGLYILELRGPKIYRSKIVVE